ncbi:hypothetical protein [Nocardia colli]|uniref:hypothetical protein n=1 Tax=Nocardia colli TaxID=2545717 RepID=UPI00168D7077|nr:hypothetical protein [Nocardia colli]
MAVVLDDFDLDVRLGKPLRVDQLLNGFPPTSEGDCGSHAYTCGDGCPTKHTNRSNCC